MKRLLLLVFATIGVLCTVQPLTRQAPASVRRWVDPSLLSALFSGTPLEATYRPTIIRSLQRGPVTSASGSGGTATATISAVTSLNFAGLRLLGCSNDDTGTSETVTHTYLVFTNTTTITSTRTSTTSTNVTCNFEVTEYYPDVLKQAIQRNTMALAAVASNTATLTSVVTGKTEVDVLGNSSPVDANDQSWVKCTLTSATVLTCSRGTATNTATVSWQATEFK